MNKHHHNDDHNDSGHDSHNNTNNVNTNNNKNNNNNNNKNNNNNGNYVNLEECSHANIAIVAVTTLAWNDPVHDCLTWAVGLYVMADTDNDPTKSVANKVFVSLK